MRSEQKAAAAIRSGLRILTGRRRSFAGWTMVLMLIAAACSDATAPSDPITVGTVEVTPGTGQLEVGSGMNLIAVVRSPQGDTIRGRAVVWKSWS